MERNVSQKDASYPVGRVVSTQLFHCSSRMNGPFRSRPYRTVIAGQSSGAQESIRLFTQPGRLFGREFTERLPLVPVIDKTAPVFDPKAVVYIACVAISRIVGGPYRSAVLHLAVTARFTFIRGEQRRLLQVC
jgi:hypothetical protein